jgi:peptidyl-prolyl cis-trans isomerase SurA
MFHLVEIQNLIPPGIKSFDDARASVISDYQDQLEKEWVAALKKKYPVSINSKGKKAVIQELTVKK